MPVRRPSASVGFIALGSTPSIAITSRSHKSSESQHLLTGYGGLGVGGSGGLQQHSILTSGSLANPQQKVVQVLINRLKNKLPCNSGVSLDKLEADPAMQQAIEALVELCYDSLDIITWALSELLERLAKQTDGSGLLSMEVLQSQLFVLKILSYAMSSRWSQRDVRPQSQSSNRATPESPRPSVSGRRSYQVPSERSGTPLAWAEPVALDDNCARYILSVMVLFLRQTVPHEKRLMGTPGADTSFRDYEALDVSSGTTMLDQCISYLAPWSQTLFGSQNGNGAGANGNPNGVQALRNQRSANSVRSGNISINSAIPAPTQCLAYEKTHQSLVKSYMSVHLLIAKFTGTIVYHLSASNWSVVFNRLRTKIHYLASTSEENPDTVDLHLMAHSALDRFRLVQVLNELSSLLVNMRKEAQIAIAVPLRTALWNWLTIFPVEFNEVIRSRGRMDGSPERVFDILYSMNQSGSERALWPTLMILNCITSERLSLDFQGGRFGNGAKINRKEYRFIEDVIRNSNVNSKLSEVAMVCALDLCKASTHVRPDGELPLRTLALDFAHEIKSFIWTNVNQKPFWESTEEIDVSIYADALCTVFRYLPEEYMVIFKACLEPERSEAVKTVAVKACLALTLEHKRFPWQEDTARLSTELGPRLRNIFKSSAVRRGEVDQFGAVKRVSSRPKSKRHPAEPLSDREVLLLGILSLWRNGPAFFWTTKDGSEMEDWMTASVKLWESPVDHAVKVSTYCSFRVIAEVVFLDIPECPSQIRDLMAHWMKRSLATTLVNVATNLILIRLETDTQLLWMMIAHQIFELYSRKTDISYVKDIQLAPGRVPAFALSEIALLVSLTSPDSAVSHLAAKTLRYLSQAERQPDVPMSSIDNKEERAKRFLIYEQLGDPNVFFVGRVGHQKRVRRFVRLIAYPSAIHVAVWQECYFRWRLLSEHVIDETTQDSHRSKESEEKHFQWQNLTLFLAAFGGACVQEDFDTASLAKLIPSQYLPDVMRAMVHPGNLVDSFVKDVTNLLVADSTTVRDVARDALGSELSSRLYPRLVRHLDEVIQGITQGAGTELTDAYSLFLDQFIAVLKLLVEHSQLEAEEALDIDVSSTLLALAEFIARFSTPASYRIKIKFCLLSDSVSDRSDTLAVRKDSPARHNILEIITEWIQDPATSNDPSGARVQQDLNLACLRTAVKLFEHLQLLPPDSSMGDDTAHVVSRLFIRYSGILLKGLDVCQLDIPVSDNVSDVASSSVRLRASQREAELRELVVTGLAHLVNANTESGFKHCLTLAYNEDPRKREIFARVFARVIDHGTQFSPRDSSTVISRQSRLCELVKNSDMILAMALCETCPASEVDVLIQVLMNLFDTRASLVSLLKLMIDREIAHTENDAALFRGNSTCTRFLSAFAKYHGYNYLRNLIQPLAKTMINAPPGHGYELDPSKAGDQDVQQNQENVKLVVTSFLEILSSSVHAIPSMFREICAHIAKSVNEVWPESKFAALGAFVFLRFISPAVVAPESVDVHLPKDDGQVIRRGLMVIAKVIQNLANNIKFGKEAHMTYLNTFLEENIINVTRYLSEIMKPIPADDDHDEWLGTSYDDTDSIVLHRFFEKHADKIGKELLSLSKPSIEGDTPAVSGKRAWDTLCAALVDLKHPLESPRLSSLPKSEHRPYIELMTRCAHRSTDPVRDLFLETPPTPKNDPAVFVLSVYKINVEALDIELLMFHIFKVLSSPQYEGRQIEIILDCTSFASLSEVPLQWVKYCIELVPADIRQYLSVLYILNPNSLAQRYLRRLFNISAGAPFSYDVRACSSVSELLEQVSNSAVSSLAYATQLEEEFVEEFTDVTMRQAYQMRMPVILEVCATHLRITSVKAQPVSATLSCKCTEIIPLPDISDVYNVSTGHDPNEFIIRRSRQSVTLYFSSPVREAIVKSIRTSKSQMHGNACSSTERLSRFSNIPATLLHVGMQSIDTLDEELRSAAYDLLGAVCTYLKYDKSPIVAAKAGFIPGDPATFVVQLSERLADFCPEMTLDFISEVSAGMEKASTAQRINCLQYMSPWVKNLAYFPNPTSTHYEHSGARLRDCVRVLADLAVIDPEIASTIQKYVWSEIGQLDSTVVNAVLDELLRGAIDGGISSKRCEAIARIIAALSSINVRGRLYAKLRRSLGKTAMKPSQTLAENVHWGEIATLIRVALIAGNQSKQSSHNQLYVPEILHLVSLVAGTGQPIVRKSVYGIIMNLLQSLYLARQEDSGPELLALINDYTQAETLKLFGLQRGTPTGEYVNFEAQNDRARIDTQENLTQLLVRVMEVTSGTRGLLNVWRARWMSLVTSMAFQSSTAIQMRAFIALGTLASSDVDDDLLYQMLVAFKATLSQCDESNTLAVVGMLRCMCKLVPALADNSRYISQLFWLGVALVQSSHISFYIESTNLLRTTLENLEARGFFRNYSVAAFLLDSRLPLEDVACQLDHLLGVSFDSSFSFSLASILFKGVRHAPLKDSAEAVLRSLLRVTSRVYDKDEETEDEPVVLYPDALGYFLALLPLSTTTASYQRLLEECGADIFWVNEAGSREVEGEVAITRVPLAFLGINDSKTALLVTSFIGAILSTAQGDDAETEILYTLLADVAAIYPEIVALTYEGLQDRIKDIFANSANAFIIRAVSDIFRVALQDPFRPGLLRGSASTLSTVDESHAHGPGRDHLTELEKYDMQGLASSFQFLPVNRGHATKMINWIPGLVVRIIE